MHVHDGGQRVADEQLTLVLGSVSRNCKRTETRDRVFADDGSQLCLIQRPAQLVPEAHILSMQRIGEVLSAIREETMSIVGDNPDETHHLKCFMDLDCFGRGLTVDDIASQTGFWNLMTPSDFAAMRQYMDDHLPTSLGRETRLRCGYVYYAAIMHDELVKKEAYRGLTRQKFAGALRSGGQIYRTEYFREVRRNVLNRAVSNECFQMWDHVQHSLSDADASALESHVFIEWDKTFPRLDVCELFRPGPWPPPPPVLGNQQDSRNQRTEPRPANVRCTSRTEIAPPAGDHDQGPEPQARKRKPGARANTSRATHTPASSLDRTWFDIAIEFCQRSPWEIVMRVEGVGLNAQSFSNLLSFPGHLDSSVINSYIRSFWGGMRTTRSWLATTTTHNHVMKFWEVDGDVPWFQVRDL